ncbi:MmgE/PrpD family protein [Aureimonas sp. SK2]|uniref:MmgE/PrpD family protein n=1 Tax=Aureimonas sp. SK2 TaxID=3015992 RepID=UPI002443E579|nr:MmgE/PrpD family protein [Aureimonas sp. SK2]
MSATAALARFAAELRYEDIPSDLREKIKLHILDSIGCGVAGASNPLTGQLARFAVGEYAAGPCPILGSETRLGPIGAAFVNAGAMNALDFDDGLEFDGRGMGHPGATIVAAALSGVWDSAVTGAEFITAVAAAYEVNARVILSMQPSFERFRQVYGVCQHQVVGAAAAYGRLVGLDAEGMENAFGLAGTLASVPSLRKYNWDARPLVSFKDFNAPAAESGVRAVRLHQQGLVGARAVLDGEHGLWRMLGSDKTDVECLVSGLGSEWLAWNASFKAFPTCRWMHTALESFQTVRDERGLRADDIEEIVVLSFSGMGSDFMDSRPVTDIDAQFSLPFTLAVLASGDRPAERWYGPVSLRDPTLLDLAARVRVVVDPRFEGEMASARRRPAGQAMVRVKGGQEFVGPELFYPLGTRERPMAAEHVFQKYGTNLGGGAVAALCADELMALDTCPDVKRWLECVPIAGPSKSP